MINIINKEKCTGCHACAIACPKNCISMEKDEEGFLYPKINKQDCVNCGICEKACPVMAKKPCVANTEAYAVINNIESIRLQSSSGGVFTVIAGHVLSNGGVVFGVAFDENFDVKHICVNNAKDLSKLRGSKYVQSVIGDTYKQAKAVLDNGVAVYFTGTPCQIEGLLKYLGKEYDNLLTSDIICHGVPSPMVWQEYLKSKGQSCVRSVNFRDKAFGWGNYSVNIFYDDGTEYKSIARDDVYIKAFLSDICLRPSCYNCSFKSKSRASDITLADFWGIEKACPEMNDDKGTSLVLVHTNKGKKMLDCISDSLEIKEVDADTALIYNPSACSSVRKPENRDKFMKEVCSENFAKLVEKHTKRTFLQKVKSKLKRIWKRAYN